MKMTGAEIFVRALEDLGVDIVFGYPGGAVLNIYDALFQNTKVRHLLVRHEQGGVHMADGYARASGKTGVCLVTSGPGATNTVTGIATAAFMAATQSATRAVARMRSVPARSPAASATTRSGSC